MLTMPSFKKSLIVEQFQGNCLKLQWRGEMLFAHDTNHSKDVLILFSENLQIDIRNVLGDSEGRFIFVEALV